MSDFNHDGHVDLADFTDWPDCMGGPSNSALPEACRAFDFEYDGDVDLDDFAALQLAMASE
jgi:hypothetical protein